jgi:hypothetical protein
MFVLASCLFHFSSPPLLLPSVFFSRFSSLPSRLVSPCLPLRACLSLPFSSRSLSLSPPCLRLAVSLHFLISPSLSLLFPPPPSIYSHLSLSLHLSFRFLSASPLYSALPSTCIALSTVYRLLCPLLYLSRMSLLIALSLSVSPRGFHLSSSSLLCFRFVSLPFHLFPRLQKMK